MNCRRCDKIRAHVRENGTIFVNASIVKREVERGDVRAIYVPSMEIASEIGNMRVANMVMLGAFIEATKLLQYDTIVTMLKRLFTGSKAHLVALNEQALERGAASVD